MWFSHFYERIMPLRKKKWNQNYVELDFSMGTVLVIFSFFWMDDAPCPPPCPPQFVKLLISIVEKKMYENYEKFYFSMCIVLVIFSFFWTVNDLVCVPPPLCGMSPVFFNATIIHILSCITQKLLAQFLWNFGKLLQTWRSQI